MPKARRRDELAKLEAEMEAMRPFLGLAQEIHEDVSRIVADPSVPPQMIAQVIDAIPARERIAMAREVFAKLPPEQQWAVIEQTFGDEEIKAALAEERAARLDLVRRSAVRVRLSRKARAQSCLDTRTVPAGESLTLGLFREPEVRAAVARGHAATTCARRLVLRRGKDAGSFRVVEDVFNPEGGYFVTADYDRETWQSERLPPHAGVRAGSISGGRFEPVLYPGGRADFEVDGRLQEGHLHLGSVLLGEQDVFGGGGAAP